MVVAIIVGLFLIGSGFLVKKHPDLIAGYNSMSDEQKQRVDIKRLSSHMRNSMIVMGGIVIVGSLLFGYLGFEGYQATFFVPIILIGTLYMWIKNQTYVH
ncbi:MAG: DUF3784 domain-containing protein [Cyclobacteriaceae bacterium]